ncbi:MAG: hypothetical protein AABW80_02470 [Nanoarchaeota archaeon]
MSFVFDSSALIYLGKIGLLDRVVLLDGEKIIPKNVYDEVILEGENRMESEVSYIKELINKRLFSVKEARLKVNGNLILSKADKEVLALAKEKKCIAIVDESYASSIADSYGIENHGTIYLILMLLKRKIINKKETISFIDKIVEEGFYLSAGKYKQIAEVINQL